jgi:hypothetical protein
MSSGVAARWIGSPRRPDDLTIAEGTLVRRQGRIFFCQRVGESPRRPFHLVFLFVHKKRDALTFPPSSWIRLRF